MLCLNLSKWRCRWPQEAMLPVELELTLNAERRQWHSRSMNHGGILLCHIHSCVTSWCSSATHAGSNGIEQKAKIGRPQVPSFMFLVVISEPEVECWYSLCVSRSHIKIVDSGALGWLSWLSVQRSVLAQVMISQCHDFEPRIRLCTGSSETA